MNDAVVVKMCLKCKEPSNNCSCIPFSYIPPSIAIAKKRATLVGKVHAMLDDFEKLIIGSSVIQIIYHDEQRVMHIPSGNLLLKIINCRKELNL